MKTKIWMQSRQSQKPIFEACSVYSECPRFFIVTKSLEYMQTFRDKKFPPTVILRHRRENLKKCSLRGLESRSDFLFFTYPQQQLPVLENYILLALDAEELSEQDEEKGLLILDGTWRYAEKMFASVIKQDQFIRRSIPRGWKTAYPRRQEDCPSPGDGLASIEAIYAAYKILGREVDGLLEGYHWREIFTRQNEGLFIKS